MSNGERDSHIICICSIKVCQKIAGNVKRGAGGGWEESQASVDGGNTGGGQAMKGKYSVTRGREGETFCRGGFFRMEPARKRKWFSIDIVH